MGLDRSRGRIYKLIFGLISEAGVGGKGLYGGNFISRVSLADDGWCSEPSTESL